MGSTWVMFEAEEHQLPSGASSVAMEQHCEPRAVTSIPAGAGAGAVRVGSKFF